MSVQSGKPIGEMVERLGGIQALINILSNHAGFENLSTSTVSRWSSLDANDLPPRARQATQIICRYLPPCRSIKTAAANGLWSLLPILLETPAQVEGDAFPLLPSTEKRLAGLTITCDQMTNGQDVIDGLIGGDIDIGFVSERYKNIVKVSYARELSVIAEISRGIPLGIVRNAILKPSGGAGGNGMQRVSSDVLAGRKVVMLAKTMGAVIQSDFNLVFGFARPPELLHANNVGQMAELLVNCEADFALGWEPMISEVLNLANSRARELAVSNEELASGFGRLPDLTLLERQVKFYMVCKNHQMPFELVVRYLKSLKAECRRLNSILQNHDVDSPSQPIAFEQDRTTALLVARVSKHFATVSDPADRIGLLARVLRTTNFEITDADLDGIIALYECEEEE